MSMCAGDHVSWHLFGMGSEMDVHTAFFHGQTLLVRGHRTDVVSLFPATFVTAEMTPCNIGKWLLSCEVQDHLIGKPLPSGRILGLERDVKKPRWQWSELQTSQGLGVQAALRSEEEN